GRMTVTIGRRELLVALGGAAAAWPFATRAQQAAMPVIGFLDSRSSDGMASRLAAFRQVLKEAGLIEGENVTVIYRWAEDRADRLPGVASELGRQATVIVTTGGPPTAFAAKAATTTIPIVFLVGEDPTRLGLVTSLARPSGNLTGINMLSNELEAKRLQAPAPARAPSSAHRRPRKPGQCGGGDDLTGRRGGSSHARLATAGAQGENCS